MTATRQGDWIEAHPFAALTVLFVLFTEVALVATYLTVGENTVADWTIVAIPWVWINVGLWAMVRARVPTSDGRRRWLAAGLALAYFAVLGFVGGLYGTGVASQPSGVRVALTSIPPGWAPTLFVNTDLFRLSVVPYQFVGYLALAYLVYVTILDAAGSAITGLLGLLSCVSCTWPILASVLTGVLGSGAALSAAASSETYLLSTLVFVATVGLLYWRPGFGSRLGSGDE